MKLENGTFYKCMFAYVTASAQTHRGLMSLWHIEGGRGTNPEQTWRCLMTGSGFYSSSRQSPDPTQFKQKGRALPVERNKKVENPWIISAKIKQFSLSPPLIVLLLLCLGRMDISPSNTHTHSRTDTHQTHAFNEVRISEEVVTSSDNPVQRTLVRV